ncbi:MAG: glycosyltransferase [Paludibacteraceae bacterium]|nr:glycosyltransferase [Paludibacteraceae bacterium]
MKQPHILILTDPIGKPSYAPRLRFLCDYLLQKGYSIEVYTEQIEDLEFSHSYPIHQWSIYKNKIDWACKSIWSLLTDWRNRQFSRRVQQSICHQYFDLVYCTTFSTFPLRAAYEIAKSRHIPLMVDIRDLDEQVPDAQYQHHRQWYLRPIRNWYRNINICRRNRILRKADLITTVSPWHVDFLRQFNPHVHLIFNGFDPKQFYPQDITTDQFLVTYIGKIYEFQDISPVRLALDTLSTPDIYLNLHLPDYRLLPFDRVGDEIRRSSIMIVLTSSHAKGMMTTKFYEALGCEKPILCIPDDGGVLAETIRKTNAGIATDKPNEIQEFIISKYREWQQKGFTRQQVINKEQFDRTRQCGNTEILMQSLLPADRPLVSIIVPVYNTQDYLAGCISSLTHQTYSNLQIIMVDDGSTDQSGNIIRTFAEVDTRILYLSQSNQGQASARNLGYRHAKGEYIVFVDADDTIESDYIATLINAIGNNMMAQCGYQRITLKGEIVEQKVPRHRFIFTSPCMRIYKREAIQDIQFPKGMIYEDVIFSLRIWNLLIKNHSKVRLIHYTGYRYLLNPQSTTSKYNHKAQQILFDTIKRTEAPLWLKAYTILRLKFHFLNI